MAGLESEILPLHSAEEHFHLLALAHSYASVHWAVPAVSTIFIGMSFTLVFISFLSYLIEVYLMYSASALAANTIIRSAVGAAFPLVRLLFTYHTRSC